MGEWWNRRREVFGDSGEEAVAILRWATEQSGVTHEVLAQRLGMSRSTVSHYLRGRHPRVGWQMVVRWLQVCGLRVMLDGRRDD